MIVIIGDHDFPSLYYIRVMRSLSMMSKSELDHATFHELLTLIIR